eukprot:1018429-Amphidinium_carterae.1
MLKDIKDEEDAALKRAEAKVDTVEASLLAAQDAPKLNTLASLGQPKDDHKNPIADSLETGTVQKDYLLKT